MNRSTVFKYEIKRLMFSKEYLLLLVVVLAYSVSLLRGIVLYGVNHTAPFSLLTFSTYCFSLAPFFFVLLLVLCARQFRTSEQGAEAIIRTTSMPFHIFILIRYSAIGCAFLFALVFPFTSCFVFYRLIFNYTAFGTLLLSGVLIILPPAIFLFGISMLLGNRKLAALYILLVIVLLVSIFQIPLPTFIDISGSTAIQALHAEEYNPSFLFAFIAGRAAFLTAGIAFIVISLYRCKKRQACYDFH